ncbi:HAD family hydrolase [Massilia sp.]|uniref:HAD family hydrolase n=1 Tax=Massilia sp. TaxID=1882437 RepID=UPI0028A26AEF|nr:HAD family hydrolase [Massilia sp.]
MLLGYVVLSLKKMLKYQTLVFDCDGVLLDSNRVKTEAFRTVGLQYGEAAAESLVRYHMQNGGISRYRKFEFLLKEILGQEAPASTVDALASQYGECVERDLLQCQVATGLVELRERTAGTRWMVVSGGDQAQLRRVFAARGLTDLFDGGIYGSPTSKDDILSREISNGSIARPAIYFGDSRYDHVAATRAGLDFIFMHKWTEFSEWRHYSADNGITAVSDIEKIWPLLMGDVLASPVA